MTEAKTANASSAKNQWVFLGEGALETARTERATGRWGSVMLNVPDYDCASFPAAPEGSWGVLRAIVQRSPQDCRWAAGDEVALGAGYLFTTRFGGFPAIGVRPAGDRPIKWMSQQIIESLLHVHVALVFDPTPEGYSPHPPEPAPHPAEETANRLGEHSGAWRDRLSPRELQALSTVSLALLRIAEEDRQ